MRDIVLTLAPPHTQVNSPSPNLWIWMECHLDFEKRVRGRLYNFFRRQWLIITLVFNAHSIAPNRLVQLK